MADGPLSVETARSLRRHGFRLGQWRIEPSRNRFLADDEEKTVEPRLVDLLVCLAARPGEVLGKDELVELVWEGAFVSDNTVSQALSRLRKALGDAPGGSRFLIRDSS